MNKKDKKILKRYMKHIKKSNQLLHKAIDEIRDNTERLESAMIDMGFLQDEPVKAHNVGGIIKMDADSGMWDMQHSGMHKSLAQGALAKEQELIQQKKAMPMPNPIGVAFPFGKPVPVPDQNTLMIPVEHHKDDTLQDIVDRMINVILTQEKHGRSGFCTVNFEEDEGHRTYDTTVLLNMVAEGLTKHDAENKRVRDMEDKLDGIDFKNPIQ